MAAAATLHTRVCVEKAAAAAGPAMAKTRVNSSKQLRYSHAARQLSSAAVRGESKQKPAATLGYKLLNSYVIS